MIENRNIICFSNDYFTDPTSKHQIMKLLARNNTILWVNSIGLRKPGLGSKDVKRILAKLGSFFRGLEKAEDNLYVFTPIVIPHHEWSIVRKLNLILMKLKLKYYMRKLGMKDIICFTYMPNVRYILEEMHASLIVYHCVDEWSKFSFIDEGIVDEEHRLCEMADLVLASARTLYDKRSPYNERTYYVSHGVDYGHFQHARAVELPVPPELAGISGPVAGFFGAIHEWVDIDLLEYIVSRNPDVEFVFVGVYLVDVEKVKRHRNAHFVGRKTYDELLAYARLFDVGLIPFKVNELTISVNPIKLKEYLALNIPVISTNLPEVAVYEKVVRIAIDYEAFDRALKEEIAGRSKATMEELDRAARNETWERKVDEISRLITEVEQAKSGR